VVARPARDGSHPAAAANSRSGLLPCPQRQPQGAPRAGLACLAAQRARAAAARPNPGPSPPPTPLLTTARPRQRRPSPGAARPSTQPPDGAAATATSTRLLW
jgi:hypothetical protein